MKMEREAFIDLLDQMKNRKILELKSGKCIYLNDNVIDKLIEFLNQSSYLRELELVLPTLDYIDRILDVIKDNHILKKVTLTCNNSSSKEPEMNKEKALIENKYYLLKAESLSKSHFSLQLFIKLDEVQVYPCEELALDINYPPIFFATKEEEK
mmetsp:Transcript_9493/g.8359  ORF Transcript_9493/g.8359 Transcript_9493/m.8359 type:complete len:154 (+) Transcript_9493:129-590(+)